MDSTGCQVGYVPFDYKKLRWAAPRDWKWQAVPVARGLLPDLVPPGQPLGEITASASAETGIPVGLPLIAAAADKACEVLGAGCLDPRVACLSYGTSATINTTHQRYVEAVPSYRPFPPRCPTPTAWRCRSTAATGWCRGSNASSACASAGWPKNAG